MLAKSRRTGGALGSAEWLGFPGEKTWKDRMLTPNNLDEMLLAGVLPVRGSPHTTMDQKSANTFDQIWTYGDPPSQSRTWGAGRFLTCDVLPGQHRT